MVDLRDELGEDIVIANKGRKHYQILDYVGAPFHCVRYHAYGNLEIHCVLNMMKKTWKKKEMDKHNIEKQVVGVLDKDLHLMEKGNMHKGFKVKKVPMPIDKV